jgi:ABC-type sugar transport system ATPase subunit
MSAHLHVRPDRDANAVEAVGLTKTYHGGIQAVRGLDFTVAAGEGFGLLGPSAPASRPRSEC